MDTLSECTPHYVRCIKPNDEKKAHLYVKPRVAHQVKYLGLLENVRVRRAGFAHREAYDTFYKRYKIICPSVSGFDFEFGLGLGWRARRREGHDALGCIGRTVANSCECCW